MPGQAVVTIGSKQWTVSLATTPQELAQGLGGLSSIPAGTGMLFDTALDQAITVTTVPMLFPIDVVFINGSLVVVDLALNVAPGWLVTSEAPARYFLEINAGEAADIQTGTPVYVQQLGSSLQEQMGGIVSVLTQLVSLGFAFGALGMMTRGMLRSARGEKLLPLTKREGGCEHHPNCSTCPHLEQCNLEPATFGNPGTKVRLVPPSSRLLPEIPRRRGLRPGTKLELVTPEEEERIRALDAQGLTLRDIAERTGRAVSTIWRTINRDHPPLHRNITKARLRDLLLLRRAGLSAPEMAKRLQVDRIYIYYLLHKAGEFMDLSGETERLKRTLWAVSDQLRPPTPTTLFKLSSVAELLRGIADDAVLLLEIMPTEVPQPLEYPYDLGWIHTRALLAEEVLRNGGWCLLRKSETKLPRVAELLSACGEASRDIARGLLENWEGYETKATFAIFEMEKIMKGEE